MSTDLADLGSELTRMLTAIARMSLDGAGFDVAEVIATSAAAAAANVGGPDVLLSGRPGSWEAAALEQLLTGAMGDDPEYWNSLRTETVLIHLNVAELIEIGDWHRGLLGLDDALAALGDEYYGQPDTDDVAERYDNDAEALTKRYTTAYRLYAQRFADAVSAVATDLHLSIPPTVVTNTDPRSSWWQGDTVRNGPLWDDLLAHEIWERAHAVVPLPDVIIAARVVRPAVSNDEAARSAGATVDRPERRDGTGADGPHRHE